jgi:hypothetical protein
MKSDFLLGAAVMLLVLVAFGFAGNEDYASEIETATQTKEIKASVNKMLDDDAFDAAAYSRLYPCVDMREK